MRRLLLCQILLIGLLPDFGIWLTVAGVYALLLWAVFEFMQPLPRRTFTSAGPTTHKFAAILSELDFIENSVVPGESLWILHEEDVEADLSTLLRELNFGHGLLVTDIGHSEVRPPELARLKLWVARDFRSGLDLLVMDREMMLARPQEVFAAVQHLGYEAVSWYVHTNLKSLRECDDTVVEGVCHVDEVRIASDRHRIVEPAEHTT